MDDIFVRRLNDLAVQADRTGRFTFTGFLTEAEYAQFLAVKNQLPHCGVTAFGGYENAERLMLRFGSPDVLGYEEPFPVCCIHIAPAQDKFADALTHRDFLGAVMHLGIERSEVGDILVSEKHAWLFCRDTMADYICGLERIKHTTVRCERTDTLPQEIAPHTEHITVQCASLRADGVISKLWHLSRSDAGRLFQEGKVFLSGAQLMQSSYLLKPQDKISVRGFGKFIFTGGEGTTRKGNLILGVDKLT